MARNRMLNPNFFLDEELGGLTPRARLLYAGLWGICDDNYATLPNKQGWIKAQIFPYENPNISNLLEELRSIKKIILFKGEDQSEYWYVKNFSKYQKVDHPSKAQYPKFIEKNEILAEPSRNPRESSDSPRSELIELTESRELISSPSAGFKKDYLSKFSKPKKIFSSKHLLASEISEWSGGKLTIPMLMKFCGAKGEQFVRQCWAQTKDSDAKDKIALFMSLYGKTKVALRTMEKVEVEN